MIRPKMIAELMQYLIIANGSYETGVVCALAQNKIIIALDGAANFLEITPHFILGDFDSISSLAREKFEGLGVKFVTLMDQDQSDLEKAIVFARQQGAKHISICCAMGGARTDHTLGALSLLKVRHSKECVIEIHTAKEIIRFLKDETFWFYASVGASCAFFGWPQAIVTSSGLVWDVNKFNTQIGGVVSTSNQIQNQKVEISVEGEVLLIYPNY